FCMCATALAGHGLPIDDVRIVSLQTADQSQRMHHTGPMRTGITGMANMVVKAVFLYDDFWDQLTSTLTAATTIGEIEPVSINGLVNETKAKVGSSKMDRLEMFCHGTDNYIQAGTDTLHTYSP